MDVAIIIVNYNTMELTRKCLRSVYERTRDLDYEVYVVDNASSDKSSEMIREYFPHVKLIENSRNVGFSAANNIGIRHSDSKYIFLLNSDTVLLNNAAKIFYDFMEKEKNYNAWCCGGNLFNADMTPNYSYGNFPSLLQIIFDQFRLYRIFRHYHRNRLAVAVRKHTGHIREVEYISGADMFIRRDLVMTDGLFDEDFFLYYEETELSYRMNRKGYKSFIVPDAQIIHLSRSSSAADKLAQLVVSKRSELFFYKKCYGAAMARIAKLLYLAGYLFNYFLTFNVEYLKSFKLIYNLKVIYL